MTTKTIATEAQRAAEASQDAAQAHYSPRWYEDMRKAVQWAVEAGLIKRPIAGKRKAKDEPDAG